MTKRFPKSSKSVAVLPTDYAPLLAEIKTRIRTAQVKAALAANAELVLLYWQMGQRIAEMQAKEGWGAGVIPRLAADLHAEFPEMRGFSERNIGYMIRFALEYGEPPILQQAAAKLAEPAIVPTASAQLPNTARSAAGNSILPQTVAKLDDTQILQPAAAKLTPSDPIGILPQLAARLPWFHHVLLMEKVKDLATRIWYMQHAIEHGWSRAVLTVQIETKAHQRMGKAQTNFAQTLPPPQSDLAQQVLKDPYTFDFLTLGADARERELEQGLVEHIQKFLLELGVGFAFVGRQVHLEVAGEDYYLDLLFYHLKLRCFVVIDLKMEPFKPEFAGKMNPVRYQSYESVLLRLCSPKSQRRKPLCRRYGRSAIAKSATRDRRRAIHSPPTSVGIDLLRGVPVATRCLQAREVSENCVGQTLSQNAAYRLSHGVNFYLSAVDDQRRHPGDQPTIGLLLCKDKQQLTVEYALRDLAKPIGVAGWKTRLVESLPKNLRGALPSIEELEKRLAGDEPG